MEGKCNYPKLIRNKVKRERERERERERNLDDMLEWWLLVRWRSEVEHGDPYIVTG